MTRHLKWIVLTAGLAVCGGVQAAIVYFPDQDIPIPNTYAGVSVDFETGSSSNALNGLPGGDASFFLGGSRVSNDGDAFTVAASWQPVRTGTGNVDPIRNLTLGTTIDINTASYSSGFGASGQINSHMGGGTGFTDGTPGYLGFSLIIDDPGDPGNPLTVYGWALVTFEDNDGVGTLHEWAYEDTGSAIQVGAVPEPTGVMLVLCGAALGLRRRRR